MEYRTFDTIGDKLSLLGFGLMRLPKLPGSQNVDYDAAHALVDAAMKQGVNYYDTAYPYHDGDSERFVGSVLSKYPRDSYYLASKLPTWLVNSEEDVVRLLDEQLAKCNVEYFDFYLVHSLKSSLIDEKVIPFRIYEQLREQQKLGKIHHLGFSFHDDYACLERLLDLHDWDFGQLQINYLDWEMQGAEQLYALMEARGVPTIVMEPVRGGVLADLGAEAAAHLEAACPGKSQASWALRFVAGLPNIMCVLSGMSTMDQVLDNLATFEHFQPLSAQEQAVLMEAKEIYKAQGAVPCTACRYCMPCPVGVNIPGNFFHYNHFCATKDAALYQARWADPGTLPSDCIACGACLAKCPQKIDIPTELAKIAAWEKTL